MKSGKEGEEEITVFLDRSSRATRGKRMTRLLDDELEEDELFWNQDALKEEENDDEYEEEGEVADVFDSDFDEDEPEPDEEVEAEPVDRAQPKKRLIFPGKTSSKKKKKKKVLSKVETVPEDEKTPEQSTPSEQHHDAPDDVEVEKVIRKSTRTAVIVKQAERDAIRAALQATMKPIKRKKEGEEKRMTQEEMLLEAAQTEIMNLRNLERVLAREEEVKKRAAVHKAVYNGPQTRYLSKDGCLCIEFINGASFESQISTKSVSYPEKAVCAVTGLPAKYRDPVTGLPYATKEAFKVIRQELSEKASGISEKRSLGPLADAIPGQGFSTRQKRTTTEGRKASNFRPFARYLQFPPIEMEESE